MGQCVQGSGVVGAGSARAGGFCRPNRDGGRVTAAKTIRLDALADGKAIRHAFFTRQGGVSGGLFASLNCGFGSGDDPRHVECNRTVAAAELELGPEALVSCHQIHGTDVVTVERPWPRSANPRADGMVTRVPGIALGVLAADCAPVLFADPRAGVVGAAHGGWRGTLAGVMEEIG